jgi:hypothetical protein
MSHWMELSNGIRYWSGLVLIDAYWIGALACTTIDWTLCVKRTLKTKFKSLYVVNEDVYHT